MKIKFDESNSAFGKQDEDGIPCIHDATEERIRILKEIINNLEYGCHRGVITDINGNRIGEWSIPYYE